MADRFAAAGLLVPAPQAAFYLYPDFAPWQEHLLATRGIGNGADLATHLLHCHGMGVLPASAFGEEPAALGCGWPPRCCTASRRAAGTGPAVR